MSLLILVAVFSQVALSAMVLLLKTNLMLYSFYFFWLKEQNVMVIFKHEKHFFSLGRKGEGNP